MFNVKCDLFDFEMYVGFWAGAKQRWYEMTEDKQEYLNEFASECEFNSLTEVNDFIWFDSDDLLEEYHQENDK